MSSSKTTFLLLVFMAIFAAVFFLNATEFASESLNSDPEQNYKTYCSGCHGAQMEAFVDRKWKFGKSKESLFKAIKLGYASEGMPAFSATFSDEEIQELTDYMLQGIEKVEEYDFVEKENQPSQFTTENFNLQLDTVYRDGDIPWGMTFLPDGDLLVTEKEGVLYRVKKDQQKIKITGVPAVHTKGQGGLMDVKLHPDFEQNKWIYLTYSKPKKQGGKTLSTTALCRAQLQENRLENLEVLLEALPYGDTKYHFGSRVEFDREGKLYFSVGDRGKRDENPQSLASHCGKIHRLHADGTIPTDNPFVEQDNAQASIYSYGHRNPQGVSINPADGKIWVHEHGPRGGDEVNIIEKGLNYGWPVVSYGINYNGTTFTDKTTAPGMQNPELYWVPSIAPCGMDFVEGDRYPGWEGDLLVGSLRFKYLNRCKVEAGKIVSEEKTLENIGRVRNVKMGPDGFVYVAVENPGYIFRLLVEEK